VEVGDGLREPIGRVGVRHDCLAGPDVDPGCLPRLPLLRGLARRGRVIGRHTEDVLDPGRHREAYPAAVAGESRRQRRRATREGQAREPQEPFLVTRSLLALWWVCVLVHDASSLSR